MNEKVNKDISAKSNLHVHLSTAFVAIGIISFGMGILVNWYTLKKLTAK